MILEERMQQKTIKNIMGESTNAIDIEDAIRIANEFAEERYKQAQYDLVVMIAQDMFNVGALSADLEYLAKLKRQLKEQLATEVQSGK